MNRKEIIKGGSSESVFSELNKIHDLLGKEFKKQFNRSLPFNDEIFSRWERAKKLGFGEGASLYDSSYVFGDVKVGKDTWIGQFTIIDGSGGLIIGEGCTISAGVHIYTHDNIKQTLLGKDNPIERESVSIGDRTYIGPQSIVSKGVSIGSCCILGANSFLNSNMKDNTVYAGNPAKKIANVIIEDGELKINSIA
jgi:acetyltransferase-like isoleucine patch superfamily enzyme